GQTIMNGITQIINDPKTIIMLTAIIFGTYYASKLGYAHIKQQMERPQVIEETSLYSGLEKLKNFVITPPPLKAQDIDEIVASPEIKQKINELATILKTARQTNETMPNILFYGPPGTGKTLTARALAAQSGLDYVMFSGTSLTKLERGKDRAELDKIFAFAKKSPKGVLVFIDEAESFLGNRENTTTSEQSRELTQAFLEKVPKPSDKNIVFVFATNRRNILDSAVESRISEVVHMPYPTDREKLQLMELFIKKEVVNAGVPIEEGFTQRKQELIDLMDKKFVGRTIEEMTQKFRRKVRLGRHVSLSYEIARGVIEETNKKLVSQRKRASSLS
ncbi:AAA family ATPase, partial [Candidatus Babeliales bacterium]|nr:AAA family ATPase [Candidatus Babeliales bacterium]